MTDQRTSQMVYLFFVEALYIMVYDQFARVIDLQFPALLCYEATVRVA